MIFLFWPSSHIVDPFIFTRNLEILNDLPPNPQITKRKYSIFRRKYYKTKRPNGRQSSFRPFLIYWWSKLQTFPLARLMRRRDKPCINWGAPGLLENLPFSRTTSFYSLDTQVRKIDPAWPVTAKKPEAGPPVVQPVTEPSADEPQTPTSIHVNPRFLVKVRTSKLRTSESKVNLNLKLTPSRGNIRKRRTGGRSQGQPRANLVVWTNHNAPE